MEGERAPPLKTAPKSQSIHPGKARTWKELWKRGASVAVLFADRGADQRAGVRDHILSRRGGGDAMGMAVRSTAGWVSPHLLLIFHDFLTFSRSLIFKIIVELRDSV